MTHASPRHRAVSHRGPTRLQRSRDRVCDVLVAAPDRLPSRRGMAAAAVGGVLITGAAVGAQTVIGGSSDTADASTVSTPMASRLAVEPEVNTGELSFWLVTVTATDWSVLLVPSLAVTVKL